MQISWYSASSVHLKVAFAFRFCPIAKYYDAMTRGDAASLDEVFHDGWRVKTLAGSDADPLVVGGKRGSSSGTRARRNPIVLW